ncbi:hypothetical protein BH11ARM2_BH11ARM2_21190 [soil metagenome]
MSTLATQDRTTAASAHLSGIFFPFVGPTVVFAISRRSNPFAAYHAVHAILGEIVTKAILFVLGVISLSYSAWTLYGHYQEHFAHWSWSFSLGKMAVTWAAFAVFGLFNTLGALRAAHRAYRGDVLRAGWVDRRARTWSGWKL